MKKSDRKTNTVLFNSDLESKNKTNKIKQKRLQDTEISAYRRGLVWAVGEASNYYGDGW